MFVPEIQYQFSIHLPLLQGEMPCVSVLRKKSADIRVISVKEIPGREMESDVLLELGFMAEKLAGMDSEDSIHAHLIFSGRAMGHVEVDAIMSDGWREDSYSYITVPAGADIPKLKVEDESLPFNHFVVPRIALINVINFIYANVGTVALALSSEQSARLGSQLSLFAERAAKLPANDPEAIMEYEGEGRVMSLATNVWHHMHANRVRTNWKEDR